MKEFIAEISSVYSVGVKEIWSWEYTSIVYRIIASAIFVSMISVTLVLIFLFITPVLAVESALDFLRRKLLKNN